MDINLIVVSFIVSFILTMVFTVLHQKRNTSENKLILMLREIKDNIDNGCVLYVFLCAILLVLPIFALPEVFKILGIEELTSVLIISSLSQIVLLLGIRRFIDAIYNLYVTRANKSDKEEQQSDSDNVGKVKTLSDDERNWCIIIALLLLAICFFREVKFVYAWNCVQLVLGKFFWIDRIRCNEITKGFTGRVILFGVLLIVFAIIQIYVGPINLGSVVVGAGLGALPVALVKRNRLKLKNQ